MKKILQLIRPFRETRNIVALCLAFFLCAGSLWAQTSITWSAEDQGYENSQVIETVVFDDNVTGIFDKGTNNNAPKYYTTGAAIRCYGGNYFTISTAVGNLTEIVISFASGEGTNAITTDVGTYDDGTWSGEAQSVTFTIGGSSGHRRLASFEITYATTAPSVAIPTFSPASGTEFGDEGLSVTISCETQGASIYYTLNGDTPDNQSTLYNAAISLDATTTIKAIAYDGTNYSNVATATYTYVDPNVPGTATTPYTVAQARAAIDAGTGVNGVYATGIVSEIVTPYNSQYGNITYNISADGQTTGDQLQSYRGKSFNGESFTSENDIQVGATVVIYGNLKKYSSTYEFDAGNQLVSYIAPIAPAVELPVFDPVAGTYDEAQTVTITCATEGASIYYTTNGTEPTNASTPYTSAITVDNTTTIKAIAYLGENASNVATATYTIVSPSNISDITEVNATYMVRGTVVATNSRGFIMGDGTGYVYYYKNGAVSQSVGDMVTVSGTTGTYGQIIQFTNSATVAIATSSNYDGEPAATLITEIPDYTEGYHLSTYLEYEGELTKDGNNYLVTVGDEQIQISYPTTEQGNTLSDLENRIVHVKGYFSGINSSSRFTTMLESVEEVASTVPAITVTPATIEATAEGTEGSLTVSMENILDVTSIDLSFCDANGGELETDPDWVTAEIVEPTTTEGYTVSYTVNPNDGEARTAYFRVYIFTAGEEVYSNIVTITQDEYVAPVLDYATLPFAFDGGRDDIENTDGLTQEGLDSDYSASPKLKFKETGSWVILHFEGVPGKLSYSIKGNSFSGGTFTVQTSEDGEIYDDLKTYTALSSSVLNEEFRTIGENVRYIKWIYTNKSSGNVALGNINLDEPSSEPAILVSEDLIEVGYQGGSGSISVTYENMGDEPLVEVAFFGEDGEAGAQYDWIDAEMDGNNVIYLVNPNEGEVRTAYMKVYDVNNTTVTSNLITITQAAAPQQYTLTVSEFENLDIFTYVDNLDEMALEGAGEISVTEGASVSLSVTANEGYILSSLVVDGQNVLPQLDESGLYTFAMPSHNVTVSATAEEYVPCEWVLTSIEDLTENDVFVIVGTKESGSYAMSNDHGTGSSPSAVEVTVVGNKLSGNVPSTIQWNIGFPENEDGYIFYPNGNDTTWLYCINDNKGIRVGDNEDNVFIINEDYLYNVAKGRYLGVYNGIDWRCYTTIHNNIAGMTLGFYKKVTATEECTVALGDVESFETYTESTELRTGVLPTCWTVAHHYTTADPDTVAMVYRSFASDGTYSLRLNHRGIVAMPAIPADVDINHLKLNMMVRQARKFYSLQVGVMTDLDDESTFVPVALCNNSTTGKLPFECTFASYVVPENYEGPFYIAFKNIGTAETDPYSVNYLDEVEVNYVEEIPTCDITALEHYEYFDDLLIADDGRLVPECWTLPEEFNNIPTKNKPQLYNSFAHTGNYSLKMRDLCVYAMPKYAVTSTPITNVKMTFWLRQAKKSYQLEVGVMTNANDASTFIPVQTIDNETTGKEEVTVLFNTYTGPTEGDLYIAFRNKGNTSSWTYSYNYIDDITLVDVTAQSGSKIAETADGEVFDTDRYLESIAVYPNPTTGVLHIDAVDVQKVECYSQMGQLVGVYDNADIDLGSFANGVYMLRITVPQGVTMRKVVKK